MMNILQCFANIFYICFLWITLMNGSLLAAASDTIKDAVRPSTNVKSKDLRDCTNCYKSHEPAHKTTSSTLHSHPFDDSDLNEILPEESEKVVFSRKYSPDAMTTQDGFMPIPGPYGAKSARQARAHLAFSKPQGHIQASSPRNVNTALNHPQSRRQGRRGGDSVPQQDVLRRVQHRHPKAIEDLTVRESIASENILGNGNFEILKGGIFSDEDGNEIIGSRRMARGFGSYGAPAFLEQSRFSPIQFPPVYHRRGQNRFNPLFYPRAPY